MSSCLDDLKLNSHFITKLELTKFLSIPAYKANRWLSGEYLPSLNELISIAEFKSANLSCCIGLTDKTDALEQYSITPEAIRFTQLLNEFGIKKTAFWKEHNISQRSIEKLSSGNTDIHISTLVRIAAAINVSIDYLLGLTSVKSWDDRANRILLLSRDGYSFYALIDKNGDVHTENGDVLSPHEFEQFVTNKKLTVKDAFSVSYTPVAKEKL